MKLQSGLALEFFGLTFECAPVLAYAEAKMPEKDKPQEKAVESHVAEAAALVDLKSSRNMTRKQLRGVLDKLQKKAKEAMVLAVRALNSLEEVTQEYQLQRSEYADFESTLKERVGLVEAWLGSKLQGEVSDAKAPEFVPLQEIATEAGSAAGSAGEGADGAEAKKMAQAQLNSTHPHLKLGLDRP